MSSNMITRWDGEPSIPNDIAALADALLGIEPSDEADTFIVLDALRPLLAPSVHFDLSVAVGACPMHGCDHEICADDDVTECGKGVGWPRPPTEPIVSRSRAQRARVQGHDAPVVGR
jgi:hypothetical protein